MRFEAEWQEKEIFLSRCCVLIPWVIGIGTDTHCFMPHRGIVHQPRVGQPRAGLPWEKLKKREQPQRGCVRYVLARYWPLIDLEDATPLGLVEETRH